jgi:hypothetical protein
LAGTLSGIAALCLIAVTDAAVGGEFEPSIAVGVIRTDNVTLVPVNPESADVLLLQPGFTYTQDSSKLTADVAYRLDAYHYQERDQDELHNLLDADVSFGMVPDRFFLDFGGSRSQAIVDPEGRIPFDNLALTRNRVDRDDVYVGSSFQVPVGDNVLVNGDLRRTWVAYADPLPLPTVGGLDDYESDEAGVSVDNYRKGVGVSWAARYVYEHVDYSVPGASSYWYQQAYAELGYWVSSATRLFLVGGLESPWDTPLEASLTEPFWEVGIAREAGERFRAEFALGERSFGPSWSGEVDFDFARGSTAFSYSDTPTTSANDRYSRGGLLDPEEPNDYLSRAGSAERYISKRLQWSLDLEWTHYDFAVALFDEQREDRTRVNGAPLANELQSGADLSAAWKPGVRTRLYLRGVRVDREFADGDESDLAATTVGASYRLGEHMLLSLEVERREQEEAQTAALNYRENLVSLLFKHTF